MKEKLIIFDMDGTLVNSSITIANAINYVRQNLNLASMEQEQILRLVNDHTVNPAEVFYEREIFEPIHEKWFTEYYTNNHANELVLYDGIKELLEELKNKDHIIGLATNAYRGSTLESLTHLDVHDYFDGIACYDDVENGKPHPDMLYKLLDELNYSNEQTLFIGDGPRDEVASQRAEIPYIMVDWGFTEHTNAVQSVKELREILFHV
ncbi:MAG TPA: HAD family hydrolase [Sulfurovum sp.]|nr:HAD family hydrolase [Sulfurovum sp.]